MNIVTINVTHFLDISLFHFMVQSDVMLVTTSHGTVTAVIKDLVELCLKIWQNYVITMCNNMSHM